MARSNRRIHRSRCRPRTTRSPSTRTRTRPPTGTSRDQPDDLRRSTASPTRRSSPSTRRWWRWSSPATRDPGSRTPSAGLGAPGLRRPHRARRRLRLDRTTRRRGSPARAPRRVRPPARRERRLRRGRQRGPARGGGRHLPPPLPRRRRARSRRDATSWSRRRYRSNAGHPRAEAGERRQPRDPARGRPRHRPLRRAVHRHRTRRARPGAARRRARRLLRHHRRDARAHRPVRASSGASTPRRSPVPRTSTSAGAPGSRARVCWSRPTRVSRTGRRPTSARSATGPTSSRSRARACGCCSRRTRCGACSGWCRSGSSSGSSRRSATCSPGIRAGRAPPSAAGSPTSCTSARLRPSRRRAQRLRRVHDSELRELQVVEHHPAQRVPRPPPADRHPAPVVRRRVADRGRLRVRRRPHAGRDRVPRVPRARRASAPAASSPAGRPGHRHLRSLAGVGDLFDSFGSAWRYTGLGSRVAASRAAVALDGRDGHRARWARSGSRRPSPSCSRSRSARSAPTGWRAASSACAGPRSPPASPTASTRWPATRSRRAASGRWCCSRCCRSCCCASSASARRDDARKGRVAAAGRPRRVVRGPGTRPASACSCSPPRRFVLAVPIAGAGRMALRGFGIAVVAAVGGIVLLFPWPLAYARRPASTRPPSGSCSDPTSTSPQILRFDTGPAGRGLGDVGPGRGGGGAAVRRHRRPPGLDRAWLAARAGRLGRGVGPGALLPRHVGAAARGRAHPRRARPRPLPRHRGVGVRRRHPLVQVRVAPTGGDPRRGRDPAARARRSPAMRSTAGGARRRATGRSTLAFTQSLTTKGDFRMLWVGDPTVLPLDPVVLRDGHRVHAHPQRPR